ncbi:ABC transporter substrate-binding protein [Arthrobacter sp. Ld5]|uniref:ABC transporter substrate-binding protein n=1 Tax=Arthrobacter sp. Ld5 TaxID=649152 RepID=UPI003EB8F13D
MPEAVDVGSVLGGRYKVTAYVLASAEKDLVLDGVDQVLNRPVSILVASVDNAGQVATSARELATGDRDANIQVLDLGITDSGTYLVTNRAPAADMLDLIVQQDAPAPEASYIEPFFTDTLGSEIFGRPRSTEPETYEDEDDDHYDDYDHRPWRPSLLTGLAQRFGRRGGGNPQEDDTSDLTPVPAEPIAAQPPNEHRASTHRVPPMPSRRPGGATAAGSREEPRDGSTDGNGPERLSPAAVAAGAATGAGLAGGAATAAGTASGTGPGSAGGPSSEPRQTGRLASLFPLSAYSDTDDDTSGHHDQDEYETQRADRDDYDDGDGQGRNFRRILVGVVLAVVLVVAVVLATTHLGSVFGGSSPVAEDEPVQSTSAPAEAPTTAPAAPTAEPAPAAASPVIAGITRLVPDNPGLDAGNDNTLPLIIDGNPATFWGNQVYASDTFGGLATNLALVVELEQESTITQVTIDQLNAAGGTFSVLVNDQPTLDGAEQIAQGGFTAPTASLPIPAGADGPVTGQYVIINFTQLPRLSNIQAQFPFGLRIAEIEVS